MFDIGFGELILVLVIGLVVLGPERLPVAVKTVAGWIRVMRSMAANVQNELTQELKLQELQDNLKKMEEQAGKAISPELKASMDELKEAADTLRRSYQEPVDTLKKQFDPEALADQELEIPSVRPASAGTPASENPAPAAPSPAVAASDSQKH
ncbi:Sec-independent protein translocase protein TatB [Morganella morganii]|uniref:Sec-independent protein translocase protein TatB n=1 Tax=Morganella morganii TaxID=582 RepID=UPI001BD2BAAB|nr:Sec-independent protein translocase protein TatB [Morganella morganii]MBS9585647.1 Sec-independent protein translocase subunit TatB [Morganella morganii subsp. morganii]QWL85493.1 Sec-independent protein translocase subunit TatB [Morganella morganii subsp. morganii]